LPKVLAGVIVTRYPERVTQQGKGKMLFELIVILMPLLVGLAVIGLGHDITDRSYIQEMNRERRTK